MSNTNKAQPMPPPAPPPPPTFHGLVNAGDYSTLQAAADVAFGSVASPHGTANVTLNKTLYIPNGTYAPPSNGKPVLDLRHLHGGRIIGAGRFCTRLLQGVAGVPVVRTNGCGYAHFEGFMLEGAPESTLLDLNWDGSAGGAALQSNKFTELEFLGGKFGVNIGQGGFMGSENVFDHCFWIGNTTAALVTSNFNALQQSIIAGNVQNCGVGFWVGVGSINQIIGTGFQLSQECDIKTSGSANNTMLVAGIRTESTNFLHNDASHATTVAGITHTGLAPGNFVRTIGGMVTVQNSYSKSGRLQPSHWAQLVVDNCWIEREDWIDASGLSVFPTYTGLVDIRSVYHGATGQIHRQLWLPTAAGIEKRAPVYQVVA